MSNSNSPRKTTQPRKAPPMARTSNDGHSINANGHTEQELIAILLSDTKTASKVVLQSAALQRPHFADPVHGAAYGAICEEIHERKAAASRKGIIKRLSTWATDRDHSHNALLAFEAAEAINAGKYSVNGTPPTFERALDLANSIKDSRGIVGLVGNSDEECLNFQSEPQPLNIALRPVPQMPVTILPEPFTEWLQDISHRMSCPIEYPSAAAIVGIASVIGRKIGIRPKQFDNWQVVPNLYGGVVGSPGELKSPATEEALKPLRRLVAQAREQYAASLREYEIEIEVTELQSKAKKKAAEKAAHKGVSDAELRELIHQQKQQSVTPDNAPVLRRYIVNDSTVPALGEILLENPNGVLLHRDELTGFLKSLDMQNRESDRAFYLETWNGNGDFVYDRVARGKDIYIKSACLSIFGTIQPGPLTCYLRRAMSGEEADGLVQRFQMLVYPDAQSWQNVDRWPDAEAKNRAFAIFDALDALNPLAIGAQVDSNDEIPFLRFSPDAQKFFNNWRDELELTRLRTGREHPVIEAHLSKYRSLMPSLSLIFHLINIVDGGAVGDVSLKAAEQAAAWCDLLEEHARRIYQLAGDGNMEPALALADRIKQGSVPDGFRINDLVRKGWSNLSDSEDFKKAVDVLEDRGWLLRVEEPAGNKGGRPTQKVRIHPSLLRGESE